MMLTTLMYHDVVNYGCEYTSGFLGKAADIYKITSSQFREQIEGIHALNCYAYEVKRPSDMVNFTFDDGGVSSLHVADMLESYGFRGLFFIPTKFIGKRNFMNAEEIRDLYKRGHQIGSHSYSHPLRMSSCSVHEIAGEWRTSIADLEDVLGANVISASVPGGYYSRIVAEEAAKAGIIVLFTSEPTRRVNVIDSCVVIGRLAVRRDDSFKKVMSMARGDPDTLLLQSIAWKAKKVVKAIGGEHWFQLRRFLVGDFSREV
jgi:peptidoglycan/xylan/chitin deacetylase (PgdA/CDA1 family)